MKFNLKAYDKSLNCCHLMLSNGGVINYFNRAEELRPFIEQLIYLCNYRPGRGTPLETTDAVQFDIFIDIQAELPEFCRHHPFYSAHGKSFALAYDNTTQRAHFLINPEIFQPKHPILLNIALSMIGTVNYAMLVSTGYMAPTHCALVELDGKGAIICAPGGTGKSTCAARLPSPYRALADDCAIVMRAGDHFIAQAMPTWSLIVSEHKKLPGCRFDCSDSVKLDAIFFLEHGDTDEIEPLSGALALGYMNSSCSDHLHWFLRHLETENQQLRTNVFNWAMELTSRLPVYRLKATLNGEFWRPMLKGMN